MWKTISYNGQTSRSIIKPDTCLDNLTFARRLTVCIHSPALSVPVQAAETLAKKRWQDTGQRKKGFWPRKKNEEEAPLALKQNRF